MSHIVTIQTELKNKESIQEVCKALNVQYLGQKTTKYYNTTKSGIAVQFRNWKYPVTIQENGSVYFDNYQGSWGNKKDLDAFINEYSLVETVGKLKKKNLRYEVQRLKNNEIKIEVMI